MVTASYAGNLLTIYNPFCLKQPEMIILTVHILELYLYVCVITYSRSTYTQYYLMFVEHRQCCGSRAIIQTGQPSFCDVVAQQLKTRKMHTWAEFSLKTTCVDSRLLTVNLSTPTTQQPKQTHSTLTVPRTPIYTQSCTLHIYNDIYKKAQLRQPVIAHFFF